MIKSDPFAVKTSSQTRFAADLLEHVSNALSARGYVVLGEDELRRIWAGESSRKVREELLYRFASEIEASVAGWHERGAMLKPTRPGRVLRRTDFRGAWWMTESPA